MLKVNNLQKNYPDFSLNVDFEVKPGYITGFIGRNGSGKTTTFKSILGLIQRDGGEVSILGKDPKDLTGEDKNGLGVVLADSSFSKYITVADIMDILNAMYKDFDREMFENYIKSSKIPLNKKIKEFSTGMNAKLNLISALSHKAKFLILDEPTSGLDVVAREEVADLLREFMEQDEENSILISSHISTDLENLCDDFYLIDDGKIVFYEDAGNVMDEYGIIKLSEKDFEALDKEYLIKSVKQDYGYKCICKNRSYYLENYPNLVIEKAKIDDIIKIMVGRK